MRYDHHLGYGSIIGTTDTLVVPAAAAPLTLEYAKAHIKSISDADDVLISTWIEAAGSYFQEQTGRPIITSTYERWLDRFPCGRIELPRCPLIDVVSVLYVDGLGDLVSFTDGGSPDLPLYTVKAPQGSHATPGWIEPSAGNAWPIAGCESGAVRVQYTAGYGDTADDVPPLVQGILCWLVGHFEQFRSAVHAEFRTSVTVLPFGVEEMLRGFKYTALPVSEPRSSSRTVYR